jgi:hypothetical protein
MRLRLPLGLPFPAKQITRYFDIEALKWTKDKKGAGGILRIAPSLEDVPYLEVSFDQLFDAATVLRQMLAAGDLRALYFLWLCCLNDFNQDIDELYEPPVPHGLADFPEPVKAILLLFDLDPLLVDAAAAGIPNFDANDITSTMEQKWISSLAPNQMTKIIQMLLSGDPVELKNSLVSEMRAQLPCIDWPSSNLKRSASALLDLTQILRKTVDQQKELKAAAKAKREAEKAEIQRQKRMVEMKAAPGDWLKKTSKLVEERRTDNYREAAKILSDLREAIGGSEGEKIARTHAAHLAKKYPTLNVLKSSLRKSGLLD